MKTTCRALCLHPPTRADRRTSVIRRSWLLARVLGLVPALALADPWADPASPPPPSPPALGYPSRDPELDALPGFRNPPPGYGEVPFWWWTGDRLDRDRLVWQIDQLHRQGIAGVQVNYAHEDTEGWPTYPADPPIFSDAWWDLWRFVAGECASRDMGIGLSGYTLDWPNGRSLVSRTVYSEPDIVGRELQVGARTRLGPGQSLDLQVPPETVGARAYGIDANGSLAGTQDLTPLIQAGRLAWKPADGEWEVWLFRQVAKPGALNPIHPLAGRRVVEKFFQPFQDHAPGQSSRGLNYFFHDELQFGVGNALWTEDLPAQFRSRKGYDLFDALPALFADIGPQTPKARLDYLDVRMQLVQERYFIPIFRWHWSRGLIYGCDQGSRGKDPFEFGDYVSAVRWYTAPGHDTPGGHADLIKGKVSSSIAQLYRRPRVWLEGYHSLGWGATPARLMQATCENYLYGCNLLNLHGLYYSTHGSFWEWAPPCHHFRMPYWNHFGVFLKYFERLSYLLSQGSHRCDVAILYPVSPSQAGLGGPSSTETAFNLGTRLVEGGRDFLFIDDDSLARARIENGQLHVSEASYRALVLPNLRAARWATLLKARAFHQAGGLVIAVGALPEASDRAGRQDPILDQAVRELFGATADERMSGRRPPPQPHASGGLGLVLASDDSLSAALAEALRPIPPDVSSAAQPPIRALHRRIGPRDVYFVMGAPRGTECMFRATGRVELWDPWTGDVRPIHETEITADGTRVRLPLGRDEAQLIVFSPGRPEFRATQSDLDQITGVTRREGRLAAVGYAEGAGPRSAIIHTADGRIRVQGQAAPVTSVALDGEWDFELEPTMDNRWGDFRLPAFERWIGPEARTFRHAPESTPNPGWERPDAPEDSWSRETHGFGQKFWKLGPLPADIDFGALDARLAVQRAINPQIPVEVQGRTYRWSAYAFSWRWGKEGDPGHQGYHGLKKNVSDDFLCLGKPREGLNEILYGPEADGTRYYLWTSASTDQPAAVTAHFGGLVPASIHLNGRQIGPQFHGLTLVAGSNPLLLRYDSPGRGHVVLQRQNAGPRGSRTPLAMRWYDEPGIIPFDAHPEVAQPVAWYRFTAPPGLRSMSVTARGTVEGWVEGRPCTTTRLADRPDGAATAAVFRLTLESTRPRPAQVALRIRHERGAAGGAALPEPVRLECGPGRVAAGDWSSGSVLEDYSGGAWYRRDLIIEPSQAQSRVLLDLGEVIATAEVRLNGSTAAIRVAPPWTVDLTGQARPGTNRLEVRVFNTLANHYRTLPTRYHGSLKSGLLGPVQLRFQPVTVLAE